MLTLQHVPCYWIQGDKVTVWTKSYDQWLQITPLKFWSTQKHNRGLCTIPVQSTGVAAGKL